MISLLTCCRTHQSVIEKSTAIATDTTTISRIAAKDSASLNAKIDSIIIEEYAADDRSEQATEGHNDHGHKVSPYQKRKDTSKGAISPKKKIKVYGVNLSGTWLSADYTLNKKMTHQQTTNSEVKQKTTAKDIAGDNNVYVIATLVIAFIIALFVGYLIWKNAVQ